MHENQTKFDQLWSQLSQLAKSDTIKSLQHLFQGDSCRADRFTYSAAGLHVNISRQHINDEVFGVLLQLAKTAQVPERRQSLLNGDPVNVTEKRAVLHSALRGGANTDQYRGEIDKCLKKIQIISESVTNGEWLGFGNQAITDVVNIGIGGSDLGPRMVTEALAPYRNHRLAVHYVSNMDPADIHNTLAKLTPATTLFIIVSKSWRTPETLSNASIAREWMQAACPEKNLSKHFIAISTAIAQCSEFGVATDNILPMWDWAGGRYSLWSAVGLSIALATNFQHFSDLLDGAKQMDRHFAEADAETNLPLILALLDIWQVNFRGYRNLAILPYSHNLRLLTDHLQQLIMESNGKSVDVAGAPLSVASCPVIWGSAGTNGQHSFHQLLHQGTEVIPTEFILPLLSDTPYDDAHTQLVANCLAQAEVLMDGQSEEHIASNLLAEGVSEDEAHWLAKHKRMPGNRPSTLISFDRLTPQTLGALIALYEHRVFCSSVIWNINAFDQWGVELGKVVAKQIHSALDAKRPTSSNPATLAAIKTFQAALQRNNKRDDR